MRSDFSLKSQLVEYKLMIIYEKTARNLPTDYGHVVKKKDPPNNVLTTFPPVWEMLRRFRCVHFFLKTFDTI